MHCNMGYTFATGNLFCPCSAICISIFRSSLIKLPDGSLYCFIIYNTNDASYSTLHSTTPLFTFSAVQFQAAHKKWHPPNKLSLAQY